MASHSYLHAVSEISEGNIDIISCEDDKGEYRDKCNCRRIINAPRRNVKERVLSVFTGYMNRYITFAKKWIEFNHDKYDTVVLDHSSISGPLVLLAKSFGLRVVTIHHNYEKEYFSDNNKGLRKLLFLPHVIRWEKISYRNSDINMFLTDSDLKTFRKAYGVCGGVCKVIGTFEYDTINRTEVESNFNSETIRFVLTGSLHNYQTVDAVNYLFCDLYKYLPKNCELIIAGRNPSSQLIKLCAKYHNVTLVPNPDSIDSVINNADVYLCTTRIGGGIKLRIMDGLKNGLPVITHICSARGFEDFTNKPFFKTFSTGKEFDDCVKCLIKDLSSGTFTRSAIYSDYKDVFSFHAGKRRMENVLRSNLK